MGDKPWWTFPRIDNLGVYPDPAGPFYKPDSNIQIPGRYPIVAISPGTVTSVRQTSWGQTVVTIMLDTPLNNLATHQFYEHMSEADVSVGQHVSQGDMIGKNNYAGQVPLGFGFYSGDVYGSGVAWQTLQNDLKTNGSNGLLSPVGFLTLMGGGQSTDTSSSSTTGGFDWYGFLTQLPGGIQTVPVVIGLLLVGALGLGSYLIYKEVG